ncbi:MAG: hypothetical protein R3F20_04575 [Planctomycetota bacterium]
MLSIDEPCSIESNVTIDAVPPPSMNVFVRPEPMIRMFLPWKLIGSYHVPTPTSTVSPSLAAVIAAWIESDGVETMWTVAWARTPAQTTRERSRIRGLVDVDTSRISM